MSVLVRLPASLATHTGGAGEIPVEGETLAEAVEALTSLHPGIGPVLCDDRGNLLRFVAVFVDGVDVRGLQGMATPLTPEAEIHFVMAIAGG